jgi:hypothetical protein
MQVVRTRLQTQHAHDAAAAGGLYRSTYDAFSTMLRKEGPRAFFKGLVPRLVMSVLTSSLSSTAYEYILSLSVRDPKPSGTGAEEAR